MTVSLWQRDDDLGGLRAPVVIVGGGICGISAALACARRGVSAVVLERYSVASGASGRNAGYLMRGMAENYAVAVEKFGRDRAREIWVWSERNLASLRREGVEDLPGFAERPSCLLALEDDEAHDLAASHRLLRADGLASTLLEPPQSLDEVWRRAGPKLGLVNPGDAVCHPVRLVRHLASKLAAETVVAPCEVGSIVSAGDGVELRTSRGLVRADRVLVCTNAHAAALLPTMTGVIRPRRGQMLAAKPTGGSVDLRYAYYLNRGDEYLRTGPSGELLMGGARSLEPAGEAGDHGGTNPAVQERLEHLVRALACDVFEVAERWSGVMGFSPDGLPIVGPMPGEPRVWLCAGFTGHGMSLGHLTAMAAADAMLGEAPRPTLFDEPRAAGSLRAL